MNDKQAYEKMLIVISQRDANENHKELSLRMY